MTIQFEGYIDKAGKASLITPQWFIDRVIHAVEEEFNVEMVKTEACLAGDDEL